MNPSVDAASALGKVFLPGSTSKCSVGRSLKLLTAAMASVFSAGLVVGSAVGSVLLEIIGLPSGTAEWLLREKFFLAMFILANNLRVLLVVAVSGLVVVGPAAVLFLNGAVVGAVLVRASTKLPLSTLVLSVLPHGVLELPAFIYSAALSTAFGIEVWRRILKKRGITSETAAEYFRGLLLSALLIVAAAFIEAYVTPQLVEASLAP